MAKRLKTIKKDHTILKGILPLLEDITKISDVKRIIPGVISRGGKIKTNQPTAFLKVQRETPSGLKLLAHTDEGIQEIFLIIPKEKRKDVHNKISDTIKG